VIVHYLPPYSPDFNPIEEAFAIVKRKLLILSAFATISKEDCAGWIGNAGIYNSM
jgi:transposase